MAAFFAQDTDGNVVGMTPEQQQQMLNPTPLTQADLDEFRARIGCRNPTPQHAFSFAMLLTKIQKRMSEKEVGLYSEAILCLREKPFPGTAEDRSMSEKFIKVVERKALDARDKVVEKIAAKKERRSVGTRGKRIRLVANPAKRGIVLKDCWVVQSNEVIELRVRFDSGEEATVVRSDMQVLCAACDDKDGRLICSRCCMEFYCGPECQKRHWSTHKPLCVPYTKKD